jgi:pyruvate dehydrogenase E2 component (dihydrolipoamide acetyltransferase)
MKIFYLPDLGEGLAEAEIREWYVKEGDVVTVDQPLVSMETAKAVVDVPAPYAGKILKLHGAPNQVIQTGAPFVTFEDATKTQETNNKMSGSVVGALPESNHIVAERVSIVGGTSKRSGMKVMPAARVLAQELGIDLTTLQGTGPDGLVTVQDVKKVLTQQGASVEAGTALHGARRMMAIAMSQSHQEVVPVTLMEDVDITHLTKDTDLTALLLQAIVHACQIEPSLNAWFDGKTLEKKLFSEVNIGLAIDTSHGLFVPVIKEAATLNTSQLRQTIDHFKTGAEARTLSPSDMQGATITLSNFGSIVGKYATPIIVPPQIAILGCGRYRKAPVCVGDDIKVGRVLPLSLTMDHRAATGGEATRFLGAVAEFLSR